MAQLKATVVFITVRYIDARSVAIAKSIKVFKSLGISMKKLKDILFEPDDYDGLTWFDVICAWILSTGIFTGLVFLIRAFC